MNNEKVIGVLGGMGPEAALYFLSRLLRFTPAHTDEDHIHCIIDNNTKVPSRIKAIIEKTGANPAPVIADMAKKLELAGADILVMPCNTAHYYHSAAQSSVSIPILNMIDLTVAEAIRTSGKTSSSCALGILGSPSLRITGNYDNYAALKQATTCYPNDASQDKLLDLIKRIKGEGYHKGMLKELLPIIRELSEYGADAIIIACSELSVMREDIQSPVPLVDAIDVLAQTAVNIVKNSKQP